METTPIRTLIIEDNEDDAMLLLNTLRKNGFQPEVQRVESRDGLTAALNNAWDIVFSDFTMPNFNGHEALGLVRNTDPDIPFFFVSGTIGEDRAVEAMRLGAQDYFIKGNLKRLPSAIHRELRERDARREHRLAQERILYLANYDTLTGLPNRVQFFDHLTQRLRANSSAQVAIFNLNLFRFKEVNDYLGTAAGDVLLIEMGRRLHEVIPDDAVLARFAADEFALFADISQRQNAATLAEILLSTLSMPFPLAHYEWRVNANVGISVYPDDSDDSQTLGAHAAIALHQAQQDPGSSYCFYSSNMRTNLQQQLVLERALEHALAHNEFQLHYQPQIHCRDNRTVGVEALLRWQRPGHGFVSPAEFIPKAEASGLIVPIGEWVLREACRQAQQWRAQGIVDLRIAVNFSAFQFRQADLAATVRHTLQEFDLPAACLEVEITETALMQDANAALSILNELHDLGVSIALDDFGTGYSSLSYLKRFPVDVLKIDRAFVCDLPHDEDDAAIVRAIIAIADKLQLSVVAEGVETQEQMTFLEQTGCDLLQGYFIQRPVPAADVRWIGQISQS